MKQIPTSKGITYKEAQSLNRHDRRRLGKQNNSIIIGSSKPQVGPAKPVAKEYALTTFTGNKI